MCREILAYPHEALRTKCKDISIKDGNDVIALLEETLSGGSSNYKGVGLAANQIGIDARVCIVRYKNQKINLINPVIIKRYGNLIYEEEGCLSLPDFYLKLPRHQHVCVRASNFGGELFMNDPLTARIIMHEIEHLDGYMIKDWQTLGRNDKCMCGSGFKFKKCCFYEK